MKYAKILFTQKVGQTESTLTYQIPEEFDLTPGQALKVPLRRHEKSGILLEIMDQKPDFKTINVKEAIYEQPLLSKNKLALLKWISKYYFCPIHNVLKLFIPKRVLEGKPIKTREKKLDQIIRTEERKLTTDQKKAIQEILKSPKENNFLVHGVTGSGKTEIYAQLADNYIKKNQQVLMLVPEISLTTQMIEYFEKTLGIRAAIINSKLSEGQRYKAWMDIWKGEAKLIIGSRSAIFAPFKDLGIIIIDEEHELSYKQDSSPRYSTHKVAEKMQELNPELKIVLGSATPSIETAEKLKDSTLTLNERIGKSVLPEIEIVDLRDEFKKKNYSIFSENLQQAITQSLDKKEQVILFLNRRGSASSVVCRDCGYIEKCDECEMAKTYHSKTLGNPSLICHHCGKISTPPTLCPTCQGHNIRFLGIGTQKIETALQEEFPSARVLRADKDTTSRKDSFKNIYQAFKRHEADILVGTQMIAKGLHLPKVNLVGVILADIGLNIPDYKTAERNFQLMTQVAGRAGRSGTPGKVIIQTYNPDNISLLHAKNHNYQEFFTYERNQRAILKNPPFAKLAKILIEGTTFQNAQRTAEKIENILWKIAREEDLADELEINIYPAFIPRLRGKYRHLTLIKSPKDENRIHKLLEKLPKEYIIDPSIKIDIDPISIT